MKLILRGYSLDVDFANPKTRESFLIFQNEESGELVRLPVPEDTIVQLMASMDVKLEDEPEESEEVSEEASEESMEEEPEVDEEPPPPPQPRRQAKTMPQPPAPHVYTSARSRIRTPTSEDDVPSV